MDETMKQQRRAKLLARMSKDYLNSPDNQYRAVFDFDDKLLGEVKEIDIASYSEELGDDASADMEDYRAWLKQNPDMYVGVKNKKTGRLDAYICFTPLAKETYKKFKAGEVLDVDLEAKDIAPFQNGINDCLQMDVASREKKLPRSAAITLLDGFSQRIEKLAHEGKFIGNVLYDICSQMGFNSANLIADIEKVGETHYDDVTAAEAGMYEGRLKQSLEIEAKIRQHFSEATRGRGID